MNTVALIGRLGGDPQLRYTPNGTAVANASIAVPRRGNREETDWFDLTFWGKTAELAANHLTKGRQVGITGRLQQERWEKDGEKRSRVVVIAESVTFIGNKGDAGRGDDDFDAGDIPF